MLLTKTGKGDTLLTKKLEVSNLGRDEMKLSDGVMGKTYLVVRVEVAERITRRLEALGINEGIPVLVMNRKKNGTVIIKVRGTWLALGTKIASGIEVKEAAE